MKLLANQYPESCIASHQSLYLKMNIFYGELIEKQEDSLDKLLFTQFRKKNNDLRKWGTPFHIIIKNGNIENIVIVKC